MLRTQNVKCLHYVIIYYLLFIMKLKMLYACIDMYFLWKEWGKNKFGSKMFKVVLPNY